mmetsp:Transcript_25403/g.64432  ORF Transcript_25403/g.64432 Transcript_25403/m.64432 type:complete len:250 (+) Transcript_25403:1415-2164(+)
MRVEAHADVAHGRRQFEVGVGRAGGPAAQGEHLGAGGEGAGEAHHLHERVAPGAEKRVGAEGDRNLVHGAGGLRRGGNGGHSEACGRHHQGHLARPGLDHARGRDGDVAARRDDDGVEAGACLRVLGVHKVKGEGRVGVLGHRLAGGDRDDERSRGVLPRRARVEFLDLGQGAHEAQGAVGCVGASEAGDGDRGHVVAGEVELGLEGHGDLVGGAGGRRLRRDGLGGEGGRVLDEQGGPVLRRRQAAGQ